MHASANRPSVIREHQLREYQQGSSHYLYNTAVLPEFSLAVFSPDALATTTTVNRLGRGTAFMFEHQGVSLVLRHYQRGGLVRHFNKDFYPFLGLERTRMWREFHLLVQLQHLDLPVPTPVAAHCQRIFGFYKGDLLTRTIPNSQTLAQVLQQRALDTEHWQQLGEVLATFHDRGAYHADLNANNILLDAQGQFFLIDFDKGELRRKDRYWPAANLARLQRSLVKLRGHHSRFHFAGGDWSALLSRYGESRYGQGGGISS